MRVISDAELIRQLKLLWKECFEEDEDAYIDFFFQHRYRRENVFFEMENEQVYAATHLLPCYVTVNGVEHEVLYGYAGGVRTEFRGHNRFAPFVKRMIQSYSKPLVFCPKDSLIGFYQNMGFRQCFCYSHMRSGMTSKGEFDYLISDLTSEVYETMRNEYFQGEGYLRWDLPAIDYALLENRFCGGFNHLLTYEGQRYALIGHVEDKELFITETTIPETVLEHLLPKLCHIYHANTANAYVWNRDWTKVTGSSARSTLIGMTNEAGISLNGYMGLTLV